MGYDGVNDSTDKRLVITFHIMERNGFDFLCTDFKNSASK